MQCGPDIMGGDRIACPHFDLKIVGRARKYRSAVASAAYQSGEKLYCDFENKTKNYPKRIERIAYTEIMLPANAPPEYMNRQTLWNSVEMNESDSDSQYARRFIMALPRELTEEQNLAFLRQYCQEQFVDKGMCVDLAYHNDGDGNPHAHVLTTMRPMDEHGKWMNKSHKEYILDENGQRIKLPSGDWKSRHVNNTDWDNRGNLKKWRHEWEVLQNKYLEEAGSTVRVDMRSYEEQGNDLTPTVHLGPEATAMERRGIRTFLGDINREIKKHNALIISIKKGIEKLKEWICSASEIRKEKAAEKAALGPPIRQIIGDYVLSRIDERKDWHKHSQLKGMAKDVAVMNDIGKWMEAHNIFYLSELLAELNRLEGKAKAAGTVLHANDARRKEIAKIEECAETIIRLKPVVDAYNRTFFNSAKETYYAAHESELKDSKRAYAFLMNHHEKQLEVKPHEFDTELARMKQDDQKAEAELETIQDDLTMVRNIKKIIMKIDPELLGEKRSVHEQMDAAHETIRQRTEERNAKKPIQHSRNN